MNTKEIGELRRRQRRDRSNMTHIFGCYVNESGQIISEFRQSVGMMSENEAEKFFALLRRALGGTPGKNLIDVTFSTAQVADSEEHRLLMELRRTRLEEETHRTAFFQKVIENLKLDSDYVILIGCDSYDVPFKTHNDESLPDSAQESFTYLLCAICPVKQTKPALRYEPQSHDFHDGSALNVIAPPELGFLFPAFDDRSTNIYNALYFTKNPADNHEAVADALFRAPIPMPAARQKESFAALLSDALQEECSLDVVQSVHEQLSREIAMHKESKLPDVLRIGKEHITDVLDGCGVSPARVAKFEIDYDDTFGLAAQLPPSNMIDPKRLEIQTSDVIIKIAPDRGDLLQTRVIDGVEYLLIRAEQSVQINGVDIHIGQQKDAVTN